MEKQRKWQFLLILAVVVLTVYNILPTIFYYLKPLKEPIGPAATEKISASMIKRLDHLESETLDWIRSYCDLIQTKPLSVSIDSENPQFTIVSFAKSEDARRLRAYLPRAGSLIPFGPAQLYLPPQEESSKEVVIQRKISVRLEKEDFAYIPKNDKRILNDRIEKIALVLAGESEPSAYLSVLEQGNTPFAVLETLVSEINAIAETFGEESPLATRFAARFTQGNLKDRKASIQTLLQNFDQARIAIRQEKSRLAEMDGQESNFLVLEKKEHNFSTALHYLKKHTKQFSSGKNPWTASHIRQSLDLSNTLDFMSFHPLFSELSIDFKKDRLVLKFHPDAVAFRTAGLNKERFEQLVVNELARIGGQSFEDIIPGADEVSIPLHHLANTSGYLSLDQAKLADRVSKQLQATLKTKWRPSHPDLASLQIVDFATYQTLPLEQKALCLVVASPMLSEGSDLARMKPNSIYIAAKGIDKIAKNYEQFPESPLAREFSDDFRRLAEILYQDGFVGHPGAALPGTFVGDFSLKSPIFLHRFWPQPAKTLSLTALRKWRSSNWEISSSGLPSKTRSRARSMKIS